MEPPRPTGRVKGAAIRDFIGWYARTHGQDRLDRAVWSLPREQQEEFDLERARLGVLSSVWFPAEVVHGVLDDLTKGLDAAAYEELVESAAEATVKGLMTGAQRIIFSKLMTPSVYSRIANMAFRLNYSPGEVISEVLGPKRHRGHVEGWSGHHPFLCRMNVAIKARLYTVMGCQGVRIEERFCRLEGQDACGSVLTWD